MAEVFHELRLLEKYSRGARGGHRWSTRIVDTRGGHEQRNINFAQDRGRWRIGHLIKSPAAADEITAFHNNRRGMAIGFRFKWWRDYKAVKTFQAFGDGVTDTFQLKRSYPDILTGLAQGGAPTTITLAAAQPDFVLHAVDDTYNGKLIRITVGTGAGQARQITDYVGSSRLATVAPGWSVQPDPTSQYAIELYVYQKDVFKPTPNVDAVPFAITINDNPAAATIDYTTGLFTVTGGAPSAGAIILADFEHDWPVRFDTDFQEWTWHSVKRHDWSGIGLVEVRDI